MVYGRFKVTLFKSSTFPGYATQCTRHPAHLLTLLCLSVNGELHGKC